MLLNVKPSKIRLPPVVYLLVSIALIYFKWTLNNQTTGEENQPPVVKIISPLAESICEVQAPVRYKIKVSDAEDGDSEYKEISDKEVFLEIHYFSGLTTDRKNQLLSQRDPNAALDLMKKRQCFTCHALQGPGIGPSYAAIAGKYRNDPPAKATLSAKIIQGSKGVWGDQTMPPMPDLSEVQAHTFIQWILQQADRPDYQILVGIEGSFLLHPPADLQSGSALLTASYIDRGSDKMGHNMQKGMDQIFIKFK